MNIKFFKLTTFIFLVTACAVIYAQPLVFEFKYNNTVYNDTVYNNIKDEQQV